MLMGTGSGQCLDLVGTLSSGKLKDHLLCRLTGRTTLLETPARQAEWGPGQCKVGRQKAVFLLGSAPPVLDPLRGIS